MLNLFELIAGVSNGSKMLTQEAHKDGCLVARGHLDATKVSDANEVDDGRVTNEPRNSRCKKSSGTPIKMLMSYEMSKEFEIQQKSHPAIARLMGLDVLPAKLSIPDRGVPAQKPDKNYNPRLKPCSDQPLHGHAYHKPHRDLNEVHKQPSVADKHSKANTFKYEHFSNGCCNEISNDKRISLVRHKFMEAKRLATNPKLIFSKEFQDALGVLSSNRDIFHKFLEEPKSLPSSTVNAPEIASHQSSAKRITVLKPSGEGAGNLPSKQCTRREAKGRENDMLGMVEGFPQKTKIVVLRPSLEKLHDAEVVRESFDVSESNECSSSREMGKGITHCTQESHSSSRRDESSKGYIGDESSLNVTEGECSEEECGSPSDSEVLTPTSVFSLDNLNQLGSPFSHSSHSRSSYLLESSLIREAKRQISERWVTAKSDGICQEDNPGKGHVITLGEMLAFPKSNLEDERDDAPGVLSSIPSDRDLDENDGSMSPILIPPSSSAFHEIVSEVAETSNFWSDKSTVPKERVSSKHVKSSLNFKEKVSNFFFSKNKKPSCSTKSDVKLQHGCDQHPVKFNNDSLHCGTNQKISDVPTHNYERLLSMNINSVSDEVDEEVIVSLEEYLLAETASGCRKQHISLASEDTPSSFADDASIGCQRGISRSPPIGSVARSISGNSSAHSDNTPLNPSKLHKTNFLKVSIEEHERLHFIESLLSWSGLGRETFVMYPSRWHSVDSPLDPALLDKFFEDKETSMCRARRSYWRLLFDCVNCALLETNPAGILPIDHLTIPNGNCPTNSVVEGVLYCVEKWFSSDESTFDHEDNSSILVQTFVKKELMGKVWLEMVGSQVAEIGIAIQSQISEDLLVEALDDMIR